MIRTVILAMLALACVAPDTEAKPKNRVSSKHLDLIDKASVKLTGVFFCSEQAVASAGHQIRSGTKFIRGHLASARNITLSWRRRRICADVRPS